MNKRFLNQKNMKVLVTGATGFIGSHVADKLLAKGYEVRCMVRKTSNLRWVEGKDYELITASLSDTDSLEKAVEGVEYIYHVAGNTSAKDLDGYMQGNCQGTKNLVEAALKKTNNLQRFLYVSSQTAAGPAISLNEPTTEDMPMRPITNYGRSKKASEKMLASYSMTLPFTIVRPPAVYGPRDTEIFSIFKMIKLGLATYIGFDEKHISLVHSEDLSRGIIEAAESKRTLGKTYFISSEEFYTWGQIYKLMKKAFGKKNILSLKLPHSLVLTAGRISEFFGKFASKPPVFNYEKGIDFIQSYWICSTNSAHKDFNYSQQVSIEEGIKETIEWYRKMKWL